MLLECSHMIRFQNSEDIVIHFVMLETNQRVNAKHAILIFLISLLVHCVLLSMGSGFH